MSAQAAMAKTVLEAAHHIEIDSTEERKTNKKKQHPGWHNAVAGSMAGAGSRMATAPLDVSISFHWCCLTSAKRRLSHIPLFLPLPPLNLAYKNTTTINTTNYVPIRVDTAKLD